MKPAAYCVFVAVISVGIVPEAAAAPTVAQKSGVTQPAATAPTRAVATVKRTTTLKKDSTCGSYSLKLYDRADFKCTPLCLKGTGWADLSTFARCTGAGATLQCKATGWSGAIKSYKLGAQGTQNKKTCFYAYQPSTTGGFPLEFSRCYSGGVNFVDDALSVALNPTSAANLNVGDATQVYVESPIVVAVPE